MTHIPPVKIFDILYVKLAANGDEKGVAGRVLTGLAARQRLHILKNLGLFQEVAGRFEFVMEKKGRTVADVEEFLKNVVEER